MKKRKKIIKNFERKTANRRKINNKINNKNRIDIVHFKFDFEFLSTFYHNKNSSSHRHT